jgi:hypothetical protein
MRTLLRIKLDVEAANKAIVDGTLGQVIDALVEKTHPEASYFLAEDGRRTAYFVFDMKNSSEIPGIVEPFFMKLNAEVAFTPVMNHDDLKKGLQLWREATTG